MTALKGTTTRSLGASKGQHERPGLTMSNAPMHSGEKARETPGAPAARTSSPHHTGYRFGVLRKSRATTLLKSASSPVCQLPGPGHTVDCSLPLGGAGAPRHVAMGRGETRKAAAALRARQAVFTPGGK